MFPIRYRSLSEASLSSIHSSIPGRQHSNSFQPPSSSSVYPSNNYHQLLLSSPSLSSQHNLSSIGSSDTSIGLLYVVEFKSGRSDIFQVPKDFQLDIHVGDLVIVEADRGSDLGKVTKEHVKNPNDLQIFQMQGLTPTAISSGPESRRSSMGIGSGSNNANSMSPLDYGSMDGMDVSGVMGNSMMNRDGPIKRIYRKAQPAEVNILLAKAQDEAKAMAVCSAKVRQKKLPMEVVDAEYQWVIFVEN